MSLITNNLLLGSVSQSATSPLLLVGSTFVSGAPNASSITPIQPPEAIAGDLLVSVLIWAGRVTYSGSGWTGWGNYLSSSSNYRAMPWYRSAATGALPRLNATDNPSSSFVATFAFRSSAIAANGVNGSLVDNATGSSCTSYSTQSGATVERVLAIGVVAVGSGTATPPNVPADFTELAKSSGPALMGVTVSYRDYLGGGTSTGTISQTAASTVSSTYGLMLRPLKPV